MVEPVVHDFLSLRPLLLRVHELRPCWSLVLFEFHSNPFMSLHLALQERLLIRDELLLCPTLLSFFMVCGRLELALFEFWIVNFSLLSLLLYFADALFLPRRKSLRIFASTLLGLNLFLLSKK